MSRNLIFALFLVFTLFLFLIPFSLAASDFGYNSIQCGSFGYNSIDCSGAGTSSTNYSLVNVNNSLYWQGHTGTDGSWLTGVLHSFIELDPSFTSWLSSFIYNYNQTTPANTYTDTQITNNNASWTTTYNATYNSKVSAGNYNCSAGTTAQNITVNQTGVFFQCVASSSGAYNSSYVPYTGANNNVSLGTNNLTANNLASNNLDVATNLNVVGATGSISAPSSGGSGSYTIDPTAIYSGTENRQDSVRVYSYKTLNGIKTYSSSYYQLPTVTEGADADEIKIRFDWAWTGATGSPDGYRLLLYRDGGVNYNMYQDVVGTSLADKGNLWISGSTVTPSGYYVNNITLNGIIQPITSSINFTGNQNFIGNINVIGGFKMNGNTILYGDTIYYNTLVGLLAGNSLTTGASNVLVGYQAGQAMTTTSSSNTVVGTGAGNSMTSGAGSNVLIGASAGSGLGSGDNNNIIVGTDSNSYESGNIILGYSSTINAGISNSIDIGDYCTNSLANTMVIGSGTSPINDIYLNGISGGANSNIHASRGSGPNGNGVSLFLSGGEGLGAGIPGIINFQTSTPVGSGSTIQTLTTRMNITTTGVSASVPINTQANFSVGGTQGITASGTSCTITTIKGGIITGATCV